MDTTWIFDKIPNMILKIQVILSINTVMLPQVSEMENILYGPRIAQWEIVN